MGPIIQNRSKIIVGFDPDLRGSGIAVYDVATNTVVSTHTLRPYEAISFLLQLYQSYGSRAVFRIEMPDQKSAYGASKLKKSRDIHSTAFGSGESSAVAKMVVDELERSGACIEQVPGSERYNLSTPKARTPAVLSMLPALQLRFLRTHPISRGIPSKADAALALALFPSLSECKYNNDAVRDALMLAWPEWVYFHAK